MNLNNAVEQLLKMREAIVMVQRAIVEVNRACARLDEMKLALAEKERENAELRSLIEQKTLCQDMKP